jgi:hypothetical protein
MKGKRYTTEDKIRILREADRGQKSIQEPLPGRKPLGGNLPPMEKAVSS